MPASDSPLLDSRGRPLRLLETPGDPQRIAVFYPGLNYTPWAPLFFYLDKALEAAGWTVMAIDYRYNENAEFLAAPDAQKNEWFLADSLAVGRWVAHRTAGCQRVAYVGKSLGTSMLLHQVRAGFVADEAELVWLTPGTTAVDQFDLLPSLPQRSLVVYGTGDPHIFRAQRRPVDLPRVTVFQVPDAGHVFEVKDDIRRSITNIADVVEAVSAFLAEV